MSERSDDRRDDGDPFISASSKSIHWILEPSGVHNMNAAMRSQYPSGVLSGLTGRKASVSCSIDLPRHLRAPFASLRPRRPFEDEAESPFAGLLEVAVA
jgi:hypothetical protein